jgi:hypothetical protein
MDGAGMTKASVAGVGRLGWRKALGGRSAAGDERDDGGQISPEREMGKASSVGVRTGDSEAEA